MTISSDHHIDHDLQHAREAAEAAAPYLPSELQSRGVEHGLPASGLIDFLGYGRLDAPLWFLGIEEGVYSGLNEHTDPSALERNLRTRAAEFDPLMDLSEAMQRLGHPYGVAAATMVWQRSAQIACGLVGNVGRPGPNRGELPSAREAKRWAGDWLGTRKLPCEDEEGDDMSRLPHTFLGELRPLPMHGLKTPWERTPYAALFGYQSRSSYHDETAGYRAVLWREVLSRSAPAFVIAHGKNVWSEVDRIFESSGWHRVPGMATEAWTKSWGNDGRTRLFKVHSFAMNFPTADVSALVAYMRGPEKRSRSVRASGSASVLRPRTAGRRRDRGQSETDVAVVATGGWASDEGFQKSVLDFADGELRQYRSRRARGVRRGSNHVTVSTGDQVNYSVDAIRNTRVVKVSAFSDSPVVQRRLETGLAQFLGAGTGANVSVVEGKKGKSYLRVQWEAGDRIETTASIRRYLDWFDTRIAPLRGQLASKEQP